MTSHESISTSDLLTLVAGIGYVIVGTYVGLAALRVFESLGSQFVTAYRERTEAMRKDRKS